MTSWVLGCDLSSRVIDLIRLDADSNRAEWLRLPLAGSSAFDRCRQVPAAMPSRSWFDGCYLAAIERPRTQSMVSAAALFPVFGAVLTRLPPELEVWDVLPQHWKRGLRIGGNAKKHECAEAVIRLACGGALDHPCWDWPQDALDAYAVAYYARELNARGVAADEAREKQLVLA